MTPGSCERLGRIMVGPRAKNSDLNQEVEFWFLVFEILEVLMSVIL